MKLREIGVVLIIGHDLFDVMDVKLFQLCQWHIIDGSFTLVLVVKRIFWNGSFGPVISMGHDAF